MSTPSKSRWFHAVVFVSLTLGPSAGDSLAANGPARQRTRVDGGVLELESRGTGQPTVVFEAGAGSEMTVWRAVADRVADATATFAYNRPGYGRSHRHPSPRSSREIVELLRQGLRGAGHSPPYLLVGHSLGGLYMNLFARTYPDEVVGVVLVDSSHPGQFEVFRRQTPLVHRLLVASYEAGPAQRRYELKTIREGKDELGAAGPFPPVPLVVLTAGRGPAWEKGSSRALWLELQSELTQLSPLGRQVVVEDCKHFIQTCDPELVAESIVEVLAASRQEVGAQATAMADPATR